MHCKRRGLSSREGRVTQPDKPGVLALGAACPRSLADFVLSFETDARKTCRTKRWAPSQSMSAACSDDEVTVRGRLFAP